MRTCLFCEDSSGLDEEWAVYPLELFLKLNPKEHGICAYCDDRLARKTIKVMFGATTRGRPKTRRDFGDYKKMFDELTPLVTLGEVAELLRREAITVERGKT